jgi:hypothetical protein
MLVGKGTKSQRKKKPEDNWVTTRENICSLSKVEFSDSKKNFSNVKDVYVNTSNSIKTLKAPQDWSFVNIDTINENGDTPLHLFTKVINTFYLQCSLNVYIFNCTSYYVYMIYYK